MTARLAPAPTRLRLPAACLLLALASPVAAVDWTGAGGDANWSTGANWVGGVAPASANTTVVSFGAAGTMFPSFVDAPWTINRLDLLGPLPYALSGSTITFDGTAPQLNILGGAPTIANDLAFLVTTTLTNAIDFTLTGVPSGTVGLVKAGAGRLTLANPLIYSGTTTVTAGTLRVGNGVTGPGLLPSPVVDNAALEFDLGGGSVSIGGVSGTGTVTMLSGDVVNIGAPLTQAGATTVNAGTLFSTILNNAPLVIGAAGTVQTGDSTVGSLSGSGTLFTNLNAVTVGGDNTDTTFTGTLGGTGGLTKVGAGRLTLGILGIYSGATTVNGGTLRFGNGLVGPGIVSPPIIDNAALEFDLGAGSVSIGGVSGTGTVTMLSGDVVNIGAPLTQAGATTVNGGTLFSTILNNAPLVIGAAGTVQTGDSTVGSLSGPGTLFTNLNAVTVGGDGTSTTFSGTVNGAGGITKVGAGTLTLSNASTATGTATVNGGTLLLTGTWPGPVQVNAGGTLGGTGTASGPVTVAGGGTLSPGLSPGILNTGNFALGGVLLVEIQGTTLGTQYDNVNVTGTVNLGGGTLSLTGAYVPAPGDTFTIITNDGADAVTGTFAGLAEGATVTFNGVPLTITYAGGDGNDVVLTAAAPAAAAVPIPTLSQWVLALLALVVGAAGAARLARAGGVRR